MELNKQNIQQNFNEDIDDIKRGPSTTTTNQGKLKPRSELTPNSVDIAKECLKSSQDMATESMRTPYSLPLQLKALKIGALKRMLRPPTPVRDRTGHVAH